MGLFGGNAITPECKQSKDGFVCELQDNKGRKAVGGIDRSGKFRLIYNNAEGGLAVDLRKWMQENYEVELKKDSGY